MLAQQFQEAIVAHFFDLLAMIRVAAGPDVDVAGADLLRLRQDLAQRRRAVHGGAQDVVQPKRIFTVGSHDRPCDAGGQRGADRSVKLAT